MRIDSRKCHSRRQYRQRAGHGFSLVELMVSMAIFAGIMAFTVEAFVYGIRGAMPRMAAIQLLQDSRDISNFMRDSVERAGAGDIFERNGRQSTFAAAVIPRMVTGSQFGLTGATNTSGDGGTSGSDEVTLAGTFPITAVVAQDNGSGLMTLTYVPFSRHVSKNSSISYRQSAFQFFNRLYSPTQPSYYYPGLVPADVGQLMIIRSHGTDEMIGRYRMVRITGIAPAAAASMPTAYDVSYAIEPKLPFNRWIQELTNTNGTVKYYDASDSKFTTYAGGGVMGCDGATSVAGIITGGTADMNGVTPAGKRPQKCSIAAKAFLHTYFVNRPTTGGVPQLARYDYQGSTFPTAQDFVVIADGVEDMQIEYFLQMSVDSSGNAISLVAGPGSTGQQGFPVPVNIDSRFQEPGPANVISLRFMFMTAEFSEGMKSSSSSAYPPLSNRTSAIPSYDGITTAARMPVATTYALKSIKSSQLFGN